jgi:hypothetical protein
MLLRSEGAIAAIMGAEKQGNLPKLLIVTNKERE